MQNLTDQAKREPLLHSSSLAPSTLEDLNLTLPTNTSATNQVVAQVKQQDRLSRMQQRPGPMSFLQESRFLLRPSLALQRLGNSTLGWVRYLVQKVTLEQQLAQSWLE
jgi:hypothetical protein